jgi:hypothetical protein
MARKKLKHYLIRRGKSCPILPFSSAPYDMASNKVKHYLIWRGKNISTIWYGAEETSAPSDMAWKKL